MPKRKIDPTTGKPMITFREQRLVDEFFNNGGNGSQAAAAAGYSAARADQSAYQVLRRPEVQRRIRERIEEYQVSAHEIIGTLNSHMRGSLADFFDEAGDFSIQTAKKNGVDHLLKSITVTTREIKATATTPAQVVRTYRGTLHSPAQAATALARILSVGQYSIGPKHPAPCPTAHYPPSPPDPQTQPTDDTPLPTDHRPLPPDPCSCLESLIQQQIKELGLSRSAVINSLLRVRPKIARYLSDLPWTPLQTDDLTDQTDDLNPDHPASALGAILDFIVGLDTNSSPSSDIAPIARSSLQTEAPTAERDSAAPSPELVELRTIEYFPAQLTAPESPNPCGESESDLKTQNSKLKTISLLNNQLPHVSRSLTRRKYGPYEDIRFGDVIQEIMDNEHLTVDKAFEEIRWRTRTRQPGERRLVEQGITAFLNPEMPPPPPPPRGLDRYIRQPHDRRPRPADP